MSEPAALDYNALRFWIWLGQMGFNVLIGVYLWQYRKHAATNSKVDAVNARVECAEKDIIRIEGVISALPSQAKIESLSHDIRALAGELSETRGRLSGINRAVDLINEFLISQGKR